MKNLKIGDFEVGIDRKPYFIAEIGSNFDGSLSKAKDLIYLAKESGAQAAKFQHYTAEELVSDEGFRLLGAQVAHQKEWNGSVFEVYNKASLDKSWTHELADTCKKAGIHFMTSPYSTELVGYVDEFVPAFKIGSGDITCPKIIEEIASKNKPVLLATGASTIEDVTRSVKLIHKQNNQLILMQCNTNYAANKSDYKYQNLRVLETYKMLFPEAVLGLSDHTKEDLAVLGAYVLGARVFEKHFTDNNSNPGPDHKFAITPKEFSVMVQKTLELEALLGSHTKAVEVNEVETNVLQRRAIRARRKILAGDLLSENDVVFLRPCPKDALPPYLINELVGKMINIDVEKGQAIRLLDLNLGEK
jgi:N-acetylneuraminate synthase